MIKFNTFRTLWEKMSRAKKLDIYNNHRKDEDGDMEILPLTIENICSICCYNDSSPYENTYYIEDVYNDKDSWKRYVNIRNLNQQILYNTILDKCKWANKRVVYYYVYKNCNDSEFDNIEHCIRYFTDNYEVIKYNCTHTVSRYTGDIVGDESEDYDVCYVGTERLQYNKQKDTY